MREIKFRAWDLEKKKMWNVSLLDVGEYAKSVYSNPHRKEDVGEFSSYYRENGFDEVTQVVMQYTGLKDKNGVEIYEGDILCIEDYYHDHQEGTSWGISGANGVK